MTNQRLMQMELSIEKIDRELIARGLEDPAFTFAVGPGSPQRDGIMMDVEKVYRAQPRKDLKFSHISTRDLVKRLLIKTRELNNKRGIWGKDDRMDFYRLEDEMVKKNAAAVAAVCRRDDLKVAGGGLYRLNTKNYGKTFNLDSREPFRNQPVAAGQMCTGFLVKQDVIATAGHCLNLMPVSEMRVIFDYKMLRKSSASTQFHLHNIYKAADIIQKKYDRHSGSDWSLIKLDREVTGRPTVRLSNGNIELNQKVYIFGHPCGLPLKYAPCAQIQDIKHSYFSADLNVYSGNSGSPVFCRDTHEVIGIVVRGDSQDFRWTGTGWLSIIYSHSRVKAEKPQCTRVSEFIDHCRP